MILDTRGLDYSDSFKKVRDVISYSDDMTKEEVTVVADSREMSRLIKGFTEILFGCAASAEERNNLFLVKIRGVKEVEI